MDDLISIIVPVYNVEPFLRRCLDSILGQTYKNLEVILVDDGSTDASGTICNEYCAKDPRVRVFHQVNAGISAARNKGLDKSSGSFIVFADSDDYIELNMVEVLLSAINRYNCSYVACGFNTVTPNEEVIREIKTDKIKIFNGVSALRHQYTQTKFETNFITVWGKLYRRSLFEGVRFCTGSMFEDVRIMPYLCLQCETIVCLPYIGYHYVQTPNSITRGNSPGREVRMFQDSFEIFDDHIELYQKHNEQDLVRFVKSQAVEKVLTHAKTNKIPNGLEDGANQVAKRYIPDLLKGKVPLRFKLQYACLYLLGSKGFQRLYSILKKE